MRKVILLMMVLMFAVAGNCFAEAKFIVDARLASLLISPDIDGLSASSTGWYSVTETISGVSNLTPTILAGGRFDLNEKLCLDALGGIGGLWSDALTGTIVELEAGLRFKLDDGSLIGPNLGLVELTDLGWGGSAHVSIADTEGIIFGLSYLREFKERLGFSVTANYYSLDSSSITASGDWTVNRSSVDLSGIALQAGLTFKF